MKCDGAPSVLARPGPGWWNRQCVHEENVSWILFARVVRANLATQHRKHFCQEFTVPHPELAKVLLDLVGVQLCLLACLAARSSASGAPFLASL